MESETRAQVDDPRRTATSVAGVAAIKGCTPIHENMRNFVTIGYIVLIGDTARGIIWPTLYTLLLSLGGSSSTLGWCVATFSIGRVVGSPIFGWLSARLGPALTLQMSLLVFAFGAAIYALVRAR
jgi:MFS family permease